MSVDTVKVVIRCRPFNQKEANEGAHNIVHANHEMASVTIDPPDFESRKDKLATTKDGITIKAPRTFTFDGVFGPESTNIALFNQSFRPIVSAVTEGYNACIFAYGQTGSGKTHTMSGVPQQPGCIPNAFQMLFDFMAKNQDRQWLVKASYVEIYNEQIRDLITNAQRLQVRDDKQKGVYIVGVSDHAAQCDGDLQRIMDSGFNNRAIAATNMNATSSRSHTLFMIRLEQAEVIDGRDHIKVGFLNLVDLAGSERADKTGCTGDRLQEANSINLSLSTLGIIIQKLVDGDAFIPYRDSVLTRLLQNSLGGNSKTLMLAAINPASTNYEESMSTLRYANNAKRIKNIVRVNEDPKDAQIREMRDKIRKLEAQLAAAIATGKIPEGGITAIRNQLNIMKGGIAPEKKIIEEIVEEVEEVQDPEEAERIRQMELQQKAVQDKLKEQDESTSAAKIVIQEMQAQLLALKGQVVSGQDLEDVNRQKEREIRETRAKLAERQEKENQLKRELQRREEDKQQQQMVFNSAKEEMAAIQKLIDQEKAEIQLVIQDINDVKTRNQEELDELQNQLNFQDLVLRKKQLLLDKLVSPFELKKFDQRMVYNEDAKKYQVKKEDVVRQLILDSRGCHVQYPRENHAPMLMDEEERDGAILKLEKEGVEKNTEKEFRGQSRGRPTTGRK